MKNTEILQGDTLMPFVDKCEDLFIFIIAFFPQALGRVQKSYI